MNKRDNTYWIVVKTPNGETRYMEAVDHVISDRDEIGGAVREARDLFAKRKGMSNDKSV